MPHECNCENLSCKHGESPCNLYPKEYYRIADLGIVCRDCFYNYPVECRLPGAPPAESEKDKLLVKRDIILDSLRCQLTAKASGIVSKAGVHHWNGDRRLEALLLDIANNIAQALADE